MLKLLERQTENCSVNAGPTSGKMERVWRVIIHTVVVHTVNMVLEKELRVLHFDPQTTGSELRH